MVEFLLYKKNLQKNEEERKSLNTTNYIQEGVMIQENKALLNLSSHHTVKVVQLIYCYMKGQAPYETWKRYK